MVCIIWKKKGYPLWCTVELETDSDLLSAGWQTSFPDEQRHAHGKHGVLLVSLLHKTNLDLQFAMLLAFIDVYSLTSLLCDFVGLHFVCMYVCFSGCCYVRQVLCGLSVLPCCRGTEEWLSRHQCGETVTRWVMIELGD